MRPLRVAFQRNPLSVASRMPAATSSAPTGAGSGGQSAGPADDAAEAATGAAAAGSVRANGPGASSASGPAASPPASPARQRPAHSHSSTCCSIAPNREWLSLPFISMRITSPNCRKPVFASPCSIVSIARFSAMQL